MKAIFTGLIEFLFMGSEFVDSADVLNVFEISKEVFGDLEECWNRHGIKENLLTLDFVAIMLYVLATYKEYKRYYRNYA